MTSTAFLTGGVGAAEVGTCAYPNEKVKRSSNKVIFFIIIVF
jgi:hypothetical protein